MKHFLLGLSLFFLLGCELFDKPEKVPSYIRVDEFTFVTDYSAEGSSSSKITDCWVYFNDDLHGAFEIPFEVPVLLEGDNKLTILPGIMLNGIAETRDIYSLVERYETNVNLHPDSIVEIQPHFSYIEAAEFWLEDFEDPSIKLSKDFNSDKGFQVIDSVNDSRVFERKYCGKVELNETENYFRVVTNQLTDLPVGKDVFLELDYLNNNTLLIGVVVSTSSGEDYYPFVRLNPSDKNLNNWNKVYLQLNENISSFPNASYYKIFFEGQLDQGNANAEIYVDNIKIVYTDQ